MARGTARSQGGDRASFIGRAVELDALDRVLRDVAAGASRGIVVEGEAGIGKTFLFRELQARAVAAGFEVIASGADEIDHHRPLSVATALLGRDAPGANLGEAHDSAPGFLEMRVGDALVDRVQAAARDRPVLVAVDDVHWADSLSVSILRHVAREVLDSPVALAVACRPTPRDPALAALLRALTEHGIAVHVGAFDDEGSLELVRTIAGAEPGTSLLDRVAGAGGNPLFIVELVTALREDGAIEVDASGRAEVVSAAAPSSLGNAILHRLTFLSPETSELLGLASVIGTAFTAAELATATGRRVVELAAPLREAVAAGILADDGQRLAFRHQLIRDVLYAELPASLREALHADFARTLLAGGADPTGAAVHLGLAGGGSDIDSARAMRAAAEAVLVGTPSAAVEMLERARSLCPPGESAREGIDTDLALAMMWAGDESGIELGRRVLADESAGGDRERLHLGIALALVERGRMPEALATLDSLMASPAAAELLALAEGWRALSLAFLFDEAGAIEAARHVLDGDAPDDARCLALIASAHVEAQRANFTNAISHAGAAIDISERVDVRSVHEPMPHLNRAFLHMAVGLIDEGRDDLEAGRRQCERFGCRMHMSNYDVISSTASFVSGAWDRALAEGQRALEAAADTGMSWTAGCKALSAVIAIHRGDEATGRALIEDAEQEPSNLRIVTGFVIWARAVLTDASEGTAAAAAYLRDRWPDVLAAASPTMTGASVARMFLLGGDAESARAVADVVDLLVEAAPGFPVPLAAARWCRGLVDGDADGLVAAVGLLRATPFAFAAAQAGEDAACALATVGRADEARPVAFDALDTYEELGAVRESRRAEQRFRASGLRLGRRGSRRRAVTGWASLTPTEARVAELAAAGLTNAEIGERLFVSRHTVHTHVAHVLAKLAVSSRAALAGVIADRGPDVLGQPAQ